LIHKFPILGARENWPEILFMPNKLDFSICWKKS